MSAQKDLQGLGSYEASCRFREIAEALITSDDAIAREAKDYSRNSRPRERAREADDADPGDS